MRRLVLVLAAGAVAACDDGDGGGVVAFDSDGFADGVVELTGTTDMFPTLQSVVAGPAGSLYVHAHLNMGSSDAAANGRNVVIKLRADGHPDPTFGDGGMYIAYDAYSGMQAVRARPDGSVVILTSDDRGSVIRQLRPDGTVDAAFGTGGEVVITRAAVGDLPGDPGVYDLALAPDGSLLAIGLVTHPNATASALAVRIDASGAVVAHGVHDIDDSWVGVLPDGSGGAMVFGSRYIDLRTRPLVGRLTTDLALDPTFAAGDYARVGTVISQAMQPVALPGGGFAAIERDLLVFDATGALATGFDTDGVLALDGYPSSVAVTATGELLVQEFAPADIQPLPSPESVIRVKPDGSLDPSFGTGGLSVGPDGQGAGVVIATDGTAYSAVYNWPKVIQIRRL